MSVKWQNGTGSDGDKEACVEYIIGAPLLTMQLPVFPLPPPLKYHCFLDHYGCKIDTPNPCLNTGGYLQFKYHLLTSYIFHRDSQESDYLLLF